MAIRSGQIIKFRLTNGKIRTGQVIGSKISKDKRLVSNGRRFFTVPTKRIIKKVG